MNLLVPAILPTLLAIESCKTQNPFILKIVEIYKSLVAIGKHAIFTWIPSHLGIHGNIGPKTAADATLSPPFEPSVYNVEYSDVTDLISAKCC
jgi:hypothetical protein